MAKKSSALSWIEYLAFRTFLGVIGILPRKLLLATGITLGSLIFRLLKSQRKRGMRNLEIAFPEMDNSRREEILLNSFRSFGRVLGEYAKMPNADADYLRSLVEFDFHKEESVRSKERAIVDVERAKGRGVILIGPHLGNPEIGILAYSSFEDSISFIARRMDNPLIDSYLTSMRERFGNISIGKADSVSAVLGILAEGGVVGVLPDVNSQLSQGVFVPFFGVPACTPAGVAMLALRTNAMIIPMCCVWDEGLGKYRVTYGRMVEPVRSGDRDHNITETINEFASLYPIQ
ncbi:MAG TPA: lysophospholipid acyltransferase family protein, partial [Pyrinomonadaceae bacterium]|nr:lysophospholipid acyltransferase family protein [Pyrinomonadaceae bacterium]